MNNNMAMEIDPLSNYEYPAYSNYHVTDQPYPYDMKADQPVTNPNTVNENFHDQNTKNEDTSMNNDTDTDVKQTVVNYNLNDNVDTDIKPVMNNKKQRKNGKRSSYWSEKITDTGFAFYGCSVCNISYLTLEELDQHVTVHKNRMTSYDFRLKNLIKRKQKKKEKKKLKKLIKIKKEDLPIDIEIKPEDGYIGNEKATDFVNNENNSINHESNSTKCHSKSKNNDSNLANSENNSNDNDNNSKNNDNADKQELYNLEKMYKCFACKKQFSLSYYLKIHVRSHTDEKPYTCSICGHSFITASKLGRHNKRIHLSVRHQCRICYKFFSRFELLTRHFDKKHLEDKLEGEPYDYNAILPYLKELEEQLREKAEADEKKPKTEDLWPDMWTGETMDQTNMVIVENKETDERKDEKLEMEEFDRKDFDLVTIPPAVDIIVEEIKVDMDGVLVKKETEDSDVGEDNTDDVKDERNSSFSDDDYFPSNTWASSPKAECPAASPTRGSRGRRGKADGPLACDVCRKPISSSSYMRIHMRTHTGERPFKCYICGRGFITSSKMNRHVLTHAESWEGKDGIKVEGADVKAEAESDEDDKKNDKASKIKRAKEKFTKKPKKRSENKKYQKRPHACEFCHKRFLHIETLQVHKKSHEGEALVLKCKFCLVQMDDEAALREHEATHTGPKPYQCTICGKCYTKRETMVYHKKHHKPEKEYICDICSKRFTSPCKLQRHIVSHKVDKFVLRYECPVCAHMFNTKYHVQMHLATHQKEGLILEENRNDILAMVLQNARRIPKHADAPANLTDIIPSDERSRVCNICGEVFRHFYYLEEHLKSHGSKIAIEDINKVEEKKYTCQICSKSFKLHYYLKLHSFTHSKEKPFICQQCGKGFITKGKLKRHLETHTGLKKYQCHICYKFFTRPSYLRIHVRTIHGTQDYNFRMDKPYGLGSSISDLSAMTQISHHSV